MLPRHAGLPYIDIFLLQVYKIFTEKIKPGNKITCNHHSASKKLTKIINGKLAIAIRKCIFLAHPVVNTDDINLFV